MDTLWGYIGGYWHISWIKEFAPEIKTRWDLKRPGLENGLTVLFVGLFILSFWLLQSMGPFYGYSHFYSRYWKWVATFYIKVDIRRVAWLSGSWLQKAFFERLRRGFYPLPFCHQKLTQINPSMGIQKGASNFPSKNFQTTPKASFSR